MSRLPPTAGLTESSIEDLIISTICVPADSMESSDFERTAILTSFRVCVWASAIDISGISIAITSISFLMLQVYHIFGAVCKTAGIEIHGFHFLRIRIRKGTYAAEGGFFIR